MSMKLANRKELLYIRPKLQRKLQASRDQRWKITTEKLKKKKKELDDSASNCNWAHATRLNLLALKKKREKESLDTGQQTV